MLKAHPKFFHYAAWGVLGIVLILILTTFLDYGITWDEELQSQYGQAIVDYYLSGFKDDRYAEIFNLYLYGGTFDGLASAIDRFTPFRVYDTRHLLNALFGLLGLWGVWRLGRIFGGGAVGLMALILCAATPVYYGHMFNNPKDIPFAAGLVWTIYYMIRAAEKPSLSVVVKAGLVLGLTLGVRIGGVMVIGFWCAGIGVVSLLPFLKKGNRVTALDVLRTGRHRAMAEVLPALLIAYPVMLMCWPWAQQHPIQNPLKALGAFSNFPQDVEVLLNGVIYRSTELPWYYVPLYFGIQTPLLLLFLWAVGFVCLPRMWRALERAQKQGLVTLLLMALFPVLYAMIRRPALYDTVRHFLFVIPLGSVVAALAVREVYAWCRSLCPTEKMGQRVGLLLGAVFALSIGTQIGTMILLHPYEYIFANALTGGVQGAYGQYESDYWGSSFKEAAKELQALVAHEGGVPAGKIYKIAICGPWDSAMIYLPPDFEPVVANEPASFFLSTTRWMCQDMRPGKEVIRIARMGVPLSIVKDLRGGYQYYDGNRNEKR